MVAHRTVQIKSRLVRKYCIVARRVIVRTSTSLCRKIELFHCRRFDVFNSLFILVRGLHKKFLHTKISRPDNIGR
jgi:hypothetical protein